MNRRDFLKKTGIACVAAVATPAALVKAKPGINCDYLIKWTRVKHAEDPFGIPYWVDGGHPVYIVDCDTWRRDRKHKGIKKMIINIGSDKHHYTLNKHGNWVLDETPNKRR